MPRRSYLLTLALLSCDSLFLDNPANCVTSSTACGAGTYCNQSTQQCETLDCTINTGLCTADQDCNPATKRCEISTFVLGQPDAQTNLNAAYGMSAPYAVLLVPNPSDLTRSRLVVADGGNQRVLIWNDVPTQNRPADAVLGMPDIDTLSVDEPWGGITGSSMRLPWSLASDGVQLVVGDYSLNRLLFWNKIPTAPNPGGPLPASRLWGQISFADSQANAGDFSVGPIGVNGAKVFLDRPPGKNFYVADSFNNRVLAFTSPPNNPQDMPDFVIGQVDLSNNTAGLSASQLYNPRAVYSDGNQLYVADYQYNRVLAFSLPISQNGPSAVLVLGQADFVSGKPNRGGQASAATLNGPYGLGGTGGATPQVFVGDQLNHRVLRYTLPGTTADLVLGQADFVSNVSNRGGAASASTLSQPLEVSSDGTRLAIADYGNNRVLLWQSLPTQNGQPADLVLGQPQPGFNASNDPPSKGPLQFAAPAAVVTDGTRLYVADSGNSRVLIWNQLPANGMTNPDVVLGQTDFLGRLPNLNRLNPAAASLAAPGGISVENGQLAVADSNNNRVLIWRQIPTQNDQPADLVIGQPSFTSKAPAAGSGLSNPTGVLLYQGALYVADYNNNRVVMFPAPLTTAATATLVLGQATLATSVANLGGQSASTMANPRGLCIDQGKLLVADRNNNRVLIWNNLPTQNGQAADVVVGQTDFASSYTDTDRTRLAEPSSLLVQNGRLYVTTMVQNRILYWNQVPTTNGQSADGVLGQTDFLTALPNNPEVPPIERLSAPTGLTAAAGRLLVADLLNNRVVARGLPP